MRVHERPSQHPAGAPGLLSAVRVKLMESWEHSGFNIDASVRIGADDARGREKLARYLIRAPFSGEKITYDALTNLCLAG